MKNLINKEWKVVDPTAGAEYKVEDISIFTVDGEEVIGCSEWMRATKETFEYVVKLHNEHMRQRVEL